MCQQTILEDYRTELEYALELKVAGRVTMRGDTCINIANGRDEVPIDEYIKMWQDGITAMEAGADPELYNY